MATQTMDAALFASTHPDIAKRTSVSSLIISAIMLLAGILVFASVFEMNDKTSTLSMALMVFGAALALFGMFRLFWSSKEIVYLPTGSVTKELNLFFDLKYMDELKRLLENKKLTGEANIKNVASGNIRMDVMISKDNQFAAIQLFQFIPYTYSPVTSVCYFTGNDAMAVSMFLLKCKTV